MSSFPRAEIAVHCSVHTAERVRKSGLCEDAMAEQSEFPGRNVLSTLNKPSGGKTSGSAVCREALTPARWLPFSGAEDDL